MSGYVASAEELAALAKRIIQVNSETQGTLRSVQSTVDGVKATWTGQASTAFSALMERFHADAQKLSQALEGIAEQIDSSSATYARQEEEATQLSSGIMGRLG